MKKLTLVITICIASLLVKSQDSQPIHKVGTPESLLKDGGSILIAGSTVLAAGSVVTLVGHQQNKKGVFYAGIATIGLGSFLNIWGGVYIFNSAKKAGAVSYNLKYTGSGLAGTINF